MCDGCRSKVTIFREEFSSGMRAGSIDALDVALVDAASFGPGLAVAESLVEIAWHAKTLIIAGSGGRLGFLVQSALLRGSGFQLVASSEAADGHAVLYRSDATSAAGATHTYAVEAQRPSGMPGSARAAGPATFVT